MRISVTILLALFGLVVGCLFGYVFYLAVRALRKYLYSGEVRKEKCKTRQSLGEVLKKHRTDCHMTQEFVAEAIGVSHQSVSKWETGRSDPSTSNLLALARLFGVTPEELLQELK